MMPSPPIDDHSTRQRSRRFVTSSATARNAAFDSKPRAVLILSPTLHPATARSCLNLTLATNQSLQSRSRTLFHSHAAAKSP